MLSPADMLIVGAAALLFFGPDQLPKVARRAGAIMRDVQATSQSFIREMERAADEPVPADFATPNGRAHDLGPHRPDPSLLETRASTLDAAPGREPDASPADAFEPERSHEAEPFLEKNARAAASASFEATARDPALRDPPI